MSTHGFLAFAAGAPAKVAYVHSDAYPSGLGLTVLCWLRSVPLDDAACAVKALRVVDPASYPTPQDVERLRDYYDPHVDTLDPYTYKPRTRPTWYQVLRGTTGDPALILDAGVIEDQSGLPYAGHVHYGYVADFEAAVFEAYRGCQSRPHTDGRFALPAPGADGCYPARMLASWPLGSLPADDEFFAAFEEGRRAR